MDFVKIKEFLTQEHIIVMLLTIVIAIIILKIKDKIFNKAIKRIETDKRRHSKKEITYIKLIKNIINYVVMVIVALFILQLFGVNVSSIIAGLGVASVIAGLAINYRIVIWCSPEVRLPVKRYALRIVKLTLDENNITIPYNQIDVHQK